MSIEWVSAHLPIDSSCIEWVQLFWMMNHSLPSVKAIRVIVQVTREPKIADLANELFRNKHIACCKILHGYHHDMIDYDWSRCWFYYGCTCKRDARSCDQIGTPFLGQCRWQIWALCASQAPNYHHREINSISVSYTLMTLHRKPLRSEIQKK